MVIHPIIFAFVLFDVILALEEPETVKAIPHQVRDVRQAIYYNKENYYELMDQIQNPTVLFQVGLTYYYDKGFEDYKESNSDKIAFAFFNEAKKRGHLEAQFFLAFMYFRGFGVEKNKKTAFSLFEDLAQKGHIGAQFNLGLMYKNGYGVRKDSKKAKYWLHKSSKKRLRKISNPN